MTFASDLGAAPTSAGAFFSPPSLPPVGGTSFLDIGSSVGSSGGFGGIGSIFSGIGSVLGPISAIASIAGPLFSSSKTADTQLAAAQQAADLNNFNADIKEQEIEFTEDDTREKIRDKKRKIRLLQGSVRNRSAFSGGSEDILEHNTDETTRDLLRTEREGKIEVFRLRAGISRDRFLADTALNQGERKASSTKFGGALTSLQNSIDIGVFD